MEWGGTYFGFVWKGSAIKMLVHDFISIPEENIPKEITYNLINDFPIMHLSDRFILNNMDFFDAFLTYWDAMENSQCGLNYHGITIIPNKSLPDFINVLRKNKKNKGVQELIEFCVSSYNNKKAIIHFGV